MAITIDSTELTFKQAMENTDLLAKEHDTTLRLYKTKDSKWFVSFRYWDDWLYESDPDGDFALSELGLSLQQEEKEG